MSEPSRDSPLYLTDKPEIFFTSNPLSNLQSLWVRDHSIVKCNLCFWPKILSTTNFSISSSTAGFATSNQTSVSFGFKSCTGDMMLQTEKFHNTRPSRRIHRLCQQLAKAALIPAAAGTFRQGGRVKPRRYKAQKARNEGPPCPAGNPMLGSILLQCIKL